MSLDNFLFNTAKMDIPRPESNHTDPTPLSGDRTQLVGAPQLVASRNDVSFELVKGETETGIATLEIYNAGTGPLVWLATPSDPWISVKRNQGTALGDDLGGGASTFTISVDAANLEPGYYEGAVTIIAPSAGGAPATIGVTLTAYDRTFVPGVSKS
jgi:hypothetical protein